MEGSWTRWGLVVALITGAMGAIVGSYALPADAPYWLRPSLFVFGVILLVSGVLAASLILLPACKKLAQQTAAWWRFKRGIPSTTKQRRLGWGDSEVKAQQAAGDIPDLFARFEKQVDRHARVMSGVERRTLAAVTSVVKQQKAASKNARAIIRSNRKMRKHAIPIKDALIEIAEGYSRQIKWLSTQNGAEQKLLIQKSLFQSLIN